MAEPLGGKLVWRMRLDDEMATRALAERVATFLGPNDLLSLSGDIGAGKTTFARHLIRTIVGDENLEVPSPTFTLMQVYDAPRFTVVHADLYRLKEPEDMSELGWEEAAEGALLIIEWIERAGPTVPQSRIDIEFQLDPERGETARIATLTRHGDPHPGFDRERSIHLLLQSSGWLDAHRSHMIGDASTRAYERLTKPGASAVLMISPPRVDLPTLQYHKPYSQLAHLAEDIRPFLAIGAELVRQGYSAPRIFGADIPAGLAVLEDLGTQGVIDANGPIPDRYQEAVALLADMHGRELPVKLPLPNGQTYEIPHYDFEAYRVEVELLVDWYRIDLPASEYDAASRQPYVEMWARALGALNDAKPTWNLRDYHSPNLIWLPERSGVNRVGIIDFQDCVLGHPAYDVVSLLQDARVTVPDELELKLLSHYCRLRRERDASFDIPAFMRAYAVLGAQRASKILGIFARLDMRDMKPQYRAHIPRVERYLAKNLAHPELAEIRAWFAEYIPEILHA